MLTRTIPIQLYSTTRALALLAVILLVSCAPARQMNGGASNGLATPAGSAAPAAQGTVDSGGGNTKPFLPATDEQIKEVIKALPQLLKHVLYWQDILAATVVPSSYGDDVQSYLATHAYSLVAASQSGQQLLNNIDTAAQKLFTKGAVFKELGSVKFHGLVNGPCHDLTSNEKDGSAFNSDPKEICLSIEQIKKKIGRDNLVSEVTALAAHELVHRVGGNEAEAVGFQAQVLFSFRIKDVKGFQNQLQIGSSQIGDAGMPDDSFEFQKYLTSEAQRKLMKPTEFCVDLTVWARKIERVRDLLIEDGTQRGFFNLSRNRFSHLVSMQVQLEGMEDYCKERTTIPDQEAFAGIPSILITLAAPVTPMKGDPKPINLDTIFGHSGSNDWYVFDHALSGQVLFVPYLDAKNAKFNYDQAMKNFYEMINGYEYLSGDWSKHYHP